MNRPAKIALGIALPVLTAVAIAFLLTGRSPAGPAQGGTSAVASGTTVSPTVQAHEVAAALGRLTDSPDSLVATGSRDQVGQRAREAVPTGSTVEVNEASWTPDGAGGGVVMATVRSPGLPAQPYAVVMVSEAGAWKVAATIPIADTTTGPTQ